MLDPRRPAAGVANSRPAAVVLLLGVNLAICWRLFKVEYLDQFSSVEGFMIAIARYMSRHWGDFSWWPLWHCGMPYQDTYVPLLHLIVAATTSILRIPPARAYHAVVGAAYAAGPAMLYLMALRLGARRGAAFASAAIYSLFSPSALFMPDMARDIGGFWFARRLQVLTVYGEGPHIAAMTLIPAAILALENALLRRTGRAFAAAALAIALVFLMNVPGTMALGLAVFCWISAQPRGRVKAAWWTAGAASAFAYCLACYGVPPSSVKTVVANAGPMHSGFSNSLRHGPLLLAIVFLLVAAAGRLLARTRSSTALRFGMLYFGLLAGLVLRADPDKFELLPQAGRLHLEMEMAACVVLGCVAAALYARTPRWVRPAALALCIGVALIQFRHYRSSSRSYVHYADLSKRSEFTTARWLDATMNGERVYATGSAGFWLNAFTDTPQMIGCCDQSLRTPVLAYVPLAINAGVSAQETDTAKLWLQSLGVRAMVASGPASTDEYKDVKQPERFERVFPVLHRERGDTTYEVLPAGSSLAHVLRPGEEIPIEPFARMEESDLARYVGALSDGRRPGASFQWKRGGEARIRANLQPSDLVSVQVAWFKGWNAYVHGARKATVADGLGFILIRPECEGNCDIDLRWTGPPDVAIAGAISVLAAAMAAVLIFKRKLFRAPVSLPAQQRSASR